MRVLGIDPSVRVLGWGVLQDGNEGGKVSYVASDTIRTNPVETMPTRMAKLYKKLVSVVEEYSPDVIGLETAFVQEDPSAILKLSYAHGLVVTLAGIYQLELVELAPSVVKKTVTGNGKASKDTVRQMLSYIVCTGGRRIAFGSFDESDALAISYSAWMHHNRLLKNAS